MGEVRTQVKLTNGTDIVNSIRGLISSDQIRSLIIDAIVDTGAARSVIPAFILKKIGGRTLFEEDATYANGQTEKLGICEPIYFEIGDRRTYDEAYVVGDEVLIGQTVLEKMDLLVDCKSQKVIPNPKHPNGPLLRI